MSYDFFDDLTSAGQDRYGNEVSATFSHQLTEGIHYVEFADGSGVVNTRTSEVFVVSIKPTNRAVVLNTLGEAFGTAGKIADVYELATTFKQGYNNSDETTKVGRILDGAEASVPVSMSIILGGAMGSLAVTACAPSIWGSAACGLAGGYVGSKLGGNVDVPARQQGVDRALRHPRV